MGVYRYKKCKECTSDFSCFFLHASNKKKDEIMRAIAKEASEEQRKQIGLPPLVEKSQSKEEA